MPETPRNRTKKTIPKYSAADVTGMCVFAALVAGFLWAIYWLTIQHPEMMRGF
jgi:threonine/homoserine efflux transporter RhtA